MILVTGATGNVGRPTVRKLLERGASVRVFARDKARLGEVADQVEVVVGEFSDQAALRQAMRGVERLYLHALGDENEEVSAAMHAARAEGVAHVVHLSSLSASMPGPSAQSQWFLQREAVVREAGLKWTMLRPGFFMSNVLRWTPSIREGVVRWLPGRFAPVDTDDVGAVAAAALTEPGHEGEIYDLTGPEIMDSRKQVEIISEVIGRQIAFQEISPADVVGMLRASGAPEGKIAFAQAVAESMTNVSWQVVTDTVEKLTGHAPRTFRQWCIENAAAFN